MLGREGERERERREGFYARAAEASERARVNVCIYTKRYMRMTTKIRTHTHTKANTHTRLKTCCVRGPVDLRLLEEAALRPSEPMSMGAGRGSTLTLLKAAPAT